VRGGERDHGAASEVIPTPQSISDTIREVLAFTPEAFAALGSHIVPSWFLEALAAHGDPDAHALMRRRRLPLDRALWVVIGMALFRDRSIEEVVEHLDLAIPGAGGHEAITASAIPPARERLGVEPVQHLFEPTGEHWAKKTAEKDRWKGLSLWGADGGCLRVADTAGNEAAFGRPGSWRSTSGYPQVRFVGLMALRSHLLGGLSVGGLDEGELTLIQPLWAKVPDQSLTILDRGLLSWWALHQLHAKGCDRHWLIRAKSGLRWREVKKLGTGDLLVEIRSSPESRALHPEMPEYFQARVISYQVTGFRPQKLITSMLDPKKYPAKQMAELYHERWELELGWDEIKTHMLEREESLRSKTPTGVRQEVAGIGIAYNLVRVEMARVAAKLKLPPTRISFRHALLLIRNFCLTAWASAPGALPRRLGGLERDMKLLVLPERRRERAYPRHVKIKMSNYARNHGKSARTA
jgi:hypothetical protein